MTCHKAKPSLAQWKKFLFFRCLNSLVQLPEWRACNSQSVNSNSDTYDMSFVGSGTTGSEAAQKFLESLQNDFRNLSNDSKKKNPQIKEVSCDLLLLFAAHHPIYYVVIPRKLSSQKSRLSVYVYRFSTVNWPTRKKSHNHSSSLHVEREQNIPPQKDDTRRERWKELWGKCKINYSWNHDKLHRELSMICWRRLWWWWHSVGWMMCDVVRLNLHSREWKNLAHSMSYDVLTDGKQWKSWYGMISSPPCCCFFGLRNFPSAPPSLPPSFGDEMKENSTQQKESLIIQAVKKRKKFFSFFLLLSCNQ